MDFVDEKAINLRIKQIRRSYFGERGKALFAKALGISPSTYNYYERNRLPSIGLLWQICRVTGVDIKWLIVGETAQENDNIWTKIPPDLLKKIANLIQRNHQSLLTLQAFVELLEQKSIVEDKTASISNQPEIGVTNAVIKESDKSHQSQASHLDASSPPWVPILGRTAAGIIHFWQETDSELPSVTELNSLIERNCQARHTQSQPSVISSDPAMVDIPRLDTLQVGIIQLNEVTDDGVCEFIDCAEIGKNYPEAFALRVDGDSMSPSICDGDIIVLSPTQAPRDGATAVVKLHGQIGVTCKIIRHEGDKVHLIAVNENYETRVYNQEDLEWAMAVLWRIRPQ